MLKKILILSLAAAFLTAASAAELSKTMPIVEHKLIKGDEPLPNVPAYPLNPGFATQSPGIVMGTTYYDYQTNGSSGNRVIICNDNSKYVVWMNLLGWPYPPAPRHIYHNWIDPTGAINPNSFTGQVNTTSGAGYVTMDLIYGNRAAVAYHSASGTPPTYVTVSIDSDPPGLGFFNHYNPPDSFPPGNLSPGRLYWPYIAVDSTGRIHITATENTDRRLQRMGYTRSNNGGPNWTPLAFVDTVMVISSVMDASPVSERVVLAYAKTQDTATQWNNDIVYIVSEDGSTWDFRYGRNNITNYGTDSDSLWAYTDLDVIFDYNDYIHIVWEAQWVTDQGIYYRTYLFHWSEQTDEITTIKIHPDSLWMDMSGAWNRPMCKMNMGVQPGGLYVSYTQFDTSDMSAASYGNGEIYMSYSWDGGQTWADTNLTNSHTPNCYPGDCDSDHWSSVADVADDSVYILYVNDKDAGGIVQTEGSATENPVMYLAMAAPTGIDDQPNRPTNFNLSQNYPNPFNARTVISFNLKRPSPVTIEVFDLTGAKVTTLIDRFMTAGTHEVVWNADGVASGVYMYKLTAGNQSETKQAVMIK